METSIPHISYTTQEYEGFLGELEKKIREQLGDNADYLLDYPIVYLHVWQSAEDKQNNQYSVYIGEANDIIDRTKDHWRDAHIPKEKRKDRHWQFHMIEDTDEDNKPVVPTLYVFGHKFFNKSFTMDIENQLIDFCLAIDTTHLLNGRGNPQGQYYGDEYFDSIFGKIWQRLKKSNPNVFLSESKIKKSALYKISPNHKLTKDQLAAKQMIIDKVSDAILYQKQNQLIMVEGDAGTGKSVLTSSTFFDILDKKTVHGTDISAYLLDNHAEQCHTYKSLATRLGHSESVIQIPSTFIQKHSPKNPVDVVFIDEAHLLWTHKTQSYNKFGDKQLWDIIARAKVTVIMFDEFQIMQKDQYLLEKEIREIREYANSQNNYIPLYNQLRMNCSQDTMTWIDALAKGHIVKPLKYDPSYDIQIFNTPSELHAAIRKKASAQNTELSRIIATYDWPYNNKNRPLSPDKYWEVKIGDWHLPWNKELNAQILIHNKKERMKYRELAWAEQTHTIDEVGSIFTIQGFDLAYAGVIIGPSIWYDKKCEIIRFDNTKKAYGKMKGKRNFKDGTSAEVSDFFSQRELRVLLSRGTDGLYIYACDPDLREALMNATKNFYN